MTTPKDKHSQLDDTLKELNSAIADWDKITNNKDAEQDLSKGPLETETKQLLEKLQKQISDLSQEP